jgi:hypothetical protein
LRAGPVGEPAGSRIAADLDATESATPVTFVNDEVVTRRANYQWRSPEPIVASLCCPACARRGIVQSRSYVCRGGRVSCGDVVDDLVEIVDGSLEPDNGHRLRM